MDYSENSEALQRIQDGPEGGLLKKIRDDFTYANQAWEDRRDEGDEDMRILVEGIWTETERKAREAAGRPAVVFDELNQYNNSVVNDLRMNKLAIKVSPDGAGSDEQSATKRAQRIRAIEHESKAEYVYANAFESCVNRSYGFFRIVTEYLSPESFDQTIRIKKIANPNAVLFDPDAVAPDWSDIRFAFIVDRLRKEEFKRRYPDAEVKDFDSESLELAPDWLEGDEVQVAEYWYKDIKADTRLEFDTGLAREAILKSKLSTLKWKLSGKQQAQVLTTPDGQVYPVIRSRKVEITSIKQCVTNGVEILSKTDYPGKHIPIVGMFGRERWYDNNGRTCRVIESFHRHARGPLKLYTHYRNAQIELTKLTPKTPLMGYEGQFATNTKWDDVFEHGVPFIEVKAKLPGIDQLLPHPQRLNFAPQIAALELGAEAAKRAIQASLGKYNASVGKEDTHARSGVAIKALDSQGDQGSFNFVDSAIIAIRLCGEIINDLLGKIEDSEREVGLVDPATDEYRTEILDASAYGEGNYGVTIAVGPSYQSQRDEAAAFASQLAENPTASARIMDLIVKSRNLGPIGDEMAARLEPPDVAAAKGANPQFLAGELQKAQANLKMMSEELGRLHAKEDAKQLELASKEKIAKMEQEVEYLKIQKDAAIVLAQLQSEEALAKLKLVAEVAEEKMEDASEQAMAEPEVSRSEQEQEPALT